MAARTTHEDEGGEGYFASISDLMVGILFVFLLMLTVFALSYAQPKDDKDDEIDRLRRENATLTVERDEARARVTEMVRETEVQRIEIAALLDRIRRLTDDLAIQERENAALSREVGELRARVRDLLAEILAVRSDNERLTTRNTTLDALLAVILSDLQRLEQNLADLSDDNGRLQRVRRTLLETMRQRLNRRGVPVELSDQYDVLRLPSEALFQLGSATFTAEGRAQAEALLEEMAALLPCYAGGEVVASTCEVRQPIFETILFEGHTDTLRADNWRLSTDRARAVLDLAGERAATLQTLRNRVDRPLLGLAGYGESRPLPGIAGTDPRNRRIEVRFLLAAFQEADLAPLRESLARLRRRLDDIRATQR
jgi:chemotaxis protein MotB